MRKNIWIWSIVIIAVVAVSVAYFAGRSSSNIAPVAVNSNAEWPGFPTATTSQKSPISQTPTQQTNSPLSAKGISPACIFPQKVFTDTGAYVEVSGTLAGAGLGQPYNTVDIACMLNNSVPSCTVASIDAVEGDVGTSDCDLLSGITQETAVITQLSSSEITAALDPSPCIQTTITINRINQTVQWEQAPVSYELSSPACKGVDTNSYYWTIESPPNSQFSGSSN